MTIAAQALNLAATITDQAGAAPDDPASVPMTTAHLLDDTARHLAHATHRLGAAREASGEARAGHSVHVARHLAGALEAGQALAAHLRAHYPAEGAELDRTVRAIGLAKAVSEDAKAATSAHLLQTVLYDAGHAQRHAEAMTGPASDEEWAFNADHAEKHLGGAQEHVAKLAGHLRDNYPDEGKVLGGPRGIAEQAKDPGTVSAQLSVTTSGQAARHSQVS